MQGSATGPFKQIIYARDNHQFVVILLQMQQTLVGVHHLLEVDVALDDMRERIVLVIICIQMYQFIDGQLISYHQRSEDATRETSTIRYEINVGTEIGLELTQ